MFRQPAPDRNLGLVVDVLHVDKSLVWPGDCHAQDFPLAFDYGSDYGPEQTSEVENLLKFLPLFAEMDGVRILRVLLKHATAVCIAAHDLGKLPWCRRWMGGPTVNEFYKKGCQEKSFRLDRSRDLFSTSSPLSTGFGGHRNEFWLLSFS